MKFLSEKVPFLDFQDVYPLEVFTAEYVVDNKQIGFLVTDSDKNLILYQYHPEGQPILLRYTNPCLLYSMTVV